MLADDHYLVKGEIYVINWENFHAEPELKKTVRNSLFVAEFKFCGYNFYSMLATNFQA